MDWQKLISPIITEVRPGSRNSEVKHSNVHVTLMVSPLFHLSAW